MKLKLTFLIFSFLSTFLLLDNLQVQKPLPPVPGTEDNPYAAAQFRYDMIRGRDSVIDVSARRNAIDYVKKNFAEEKTVSWTALGPGNIGGRIRSIIVRPSNSDHILIGSVSGGIWKSTDGGATWTAKNDDGDPLAIGCMVNDGDTVYAGTGEAWGNVDAVYGGGIWKSTDFGETWSLLSSTENTWNFKNVLQLRLDPDGNVYAVTKAYNYKNGAGGYYTNGGLYKSTDGGSSWSKISTTSVSRYYDGCDAIPITSSVILFATKYEGIYRTTDGGSNWSEVTSGLPAGDFNRIAMAQDPNTSTTVYAVFSSGVSGDPYYGLRGIYKSTDSGASWSELTRPGQIASTGNKTYLSSQGWYGNIIAIDPFNSNNIYVGGVDDMKSTDGGSSWSQLTYWHTYYGTPYVHADHHAIVFDPNNANVVYDGNDGGIFKTTDGGSNWTALNNGLEITQFYGGATAKAAEVYMGGAQDNGHLKYVNVSTWTEVRGGDGGYAEIDQNNSDIAYEEYVYLKMYKTTDGGASWNTCINGLSDANNGDYCLFIAPFSMNPENSDVLVAGSDNVWLTTDKAENWDSSGTTLSSGEKVSAVTVVNSASPYLGFAGTTDGKVFKCTSMTGGSGDTWTEITPAGNNGAWVRRITVDLNDKNKIYVCYSGYNNDGVTPTKHVWYSSDQGTNWSDISGNLPDAPVHSLVIDPTDSQTLYAGTEVGVFETNDRGGTWTRRGSGMPDYVPVDQLRIQSGTNKLFAFTHGRSAFITTSATPVELVAFTATVNGDNVELYWKTATETNNYGFQVERQKAKGENDWEEIGFVEAAGNGNSPKEYSFTDNITESGTYSYRLKQIDIDGSYEYSKVVEVNIDSPAKFELSQNYPNPFNPTTTIKYSIPSVIARDPDLSGDRSNLLNNSQDLQIATNLTSSNSRNDANVRLIVYNVLGRKITTLVNKKQSPGNYSVQFDASNLPSGVYFYTLQYGNFTATKKMLLLK